MPKRANTRSLDDAFGDALSAACQPAVILPLIISEQLRRRGVIVTEESGAALAQAIQEMPPGTESLTFDFDETPNPNLSKAEIERHLQEVLDGLKGSIAGLRGVLGRVAQKTLLSVSKEIAPLLHQSIRRRRSRLLKRSRAQRAELARGIMDHWRLAINALECEIEVAIEIAGAWTAESSALDLRRGRRTRRVLGALHARGCQIANEIVVLLSHGHADGAHARWRSLHEVATSAWLIQASGERTAMRYDEHAIVNQERMARAEIKAWPALAHNPEFTRDLAELARGKSKLEAKYGKAYLGDYGWAEKVLKTGKKHGPTFVDIERAVEFDILRPHYGLANLNVHASALAMNLRLGLGPYAGSSVLLPGASPYGLADPGTHTAWTLVLLTYPLLVAMPSVERTVAGKLIELLANDAMKRFVSAAKRPADFALEIHVEEAPMESQDMATSPKAQPVIREVRAAVGSRKGPRSSIWKFTVRGSDIYIFSRMFGSDTKVSLHASGQCQWSCTSEWVRKGATRRNADRHITQWDIARPIGTESLHVFRVQIPNTELRILPPEKDKKKVWWIGGIRSDTTVSLECYITPPSAADPAATNELPGRLLASMPLDDGRWFVVLVQLVAIDAADIDSTRAEISKMASGNGLSYSEGLRATAFFHSENASRGLIELCLKEW